MMAMASKPLHHISRGGHPLGKAAPRSNTGCCALATKPQPNQIQRMGNTTCEVLGWPAALTSVRASERTRALRVHEPCWPSKRWLAQPTKKARPTSKKASANKPPPPPSQAVAGRCAMRGSLVRAKWVVTTMFGAAGAGRKYMCAAKPASAILTRPATESTNQPTNEPRHMVGTSWTPWRSLEKRSKRANAMPSIRRPGADGRQNANNECGLAQSDHVQVCTCQKDRRASHNHGHRQIADKSLDGADRPPTPPCAHGCKPSLDGGALSCKLEQVMF